MTLIHSDQKTTQAHKLLQHIQTTTVHIRHACALNRHRLAPDFNLFQFIQPDELKLSQIIAWLLDPNGSHGQGAYFLKSFIAELGLNWPERACELATVRREVPTHRLVRYNRRIDILITSGEYALAIENKPWANDQEKQLSDYLAHIDAEYKNSCLLYLSGQTDLADSHSLSPTERYAALSTHRLVERTFPAFTHWIQTVETGCQAEQVRSFLHHLIAYLRAEFEGVRSVPEQDQLVNQILDDPNLLTPALDLLIAGDAIRNGLINQLHLQLTQSATPKGWKVDCRLDQPPYAKVAIYFPELQQHPFTIEFQSTPFKGLIFGIQNTEPKSNQNHIRQRISPFLGSARQSAYWTWFRSCSPHDSLLPMADNWLISSDPWLGIQTGTTAQTILKCAEVFHSALCLSDPLNISRIS